jgi:hypothetical protein
LDPTRSNGAIGAIGVIALLGSGASEVCFVLETPSHSHKHFFDHAVKKSTNSLLFSKDRT